ncbi:MAG: hypothetical protein LBS01_10520 [Prevotellaceae bacterium]|jgi:hypothetical protein|nr:hypothetical protein [Prevotellaceae bacterium]
MKKFVLFLAAAMLLCGMATMNSCKSDDPNKDDETTVYDPAKDGIVGEWLSEGDNVATLLSMYFQVEKLEANFKADKTYIVNQYNKDGTSNVLTGTYQQAKSTTGNIWTIVVNQSGGGATTVTSEGIFEVTKEGDGYTMKYEIVQTSPALSTAPPTPEGGFGSSGGGSLGTDNIQKFVRVEKK